MFLQRIGQFLASRTRAALVGRFPRSRAVLPGFHVLAYWPCLFNVLASFQRRAHMLRWSDVFRGVGRFCPVSTFWRSVHVSATYWPVFSVALMCCASLDVFRGVGRFCPASTFLRIGHVCSTYCPVFSVARTCCASLDVFRGVGRF